jgi:uncharacterized membrane protein
MQRIKSLDLARGFTVLMIAPIHTVMLYSKLYVHDTLLGKFLAFVAEWHGAQIFMLLMGISFAFSSKHTFESVCKRSFYLLLIAYSLNIFKFVIPHVLGWLPENLLAEIQIQKGITGYLQLFLIGDILHFAAIATLILYFVYLLPRNHEFAIIFAGFVCFFASLFWDANSDNIFINYLLQLTTGSPPHVFFPLFPWLTYPVIGLALGYFFKTDNHQHVFWFIRDLGWILIASRILLISIPVNTLPSAFYRTGSLDTIFHIGVVLVALSCWDWVSNNVKQNHFFRLLTYLSENITQVYIIQWILICWLFPFFGYQTLGLFSSLCTIILNSFLTLAISFLWGNRSFMI